MKTNRIKALNDIRSREEFERVINATVDMQIVKERTELRRDKKILEVRQDYDEDIAELGDTIQANVIRAEKYAATHREELLPSKKKSGETSFAFFGFRTGNPTLVLLNRKWTWKKVLEELKRLYRRDYVITKEYVDKDAVKRDMAGEALAECGLRIEQSEVFFIDPKRDPADPQRLVSEAKVAA